jgi:hypothetical protein
MPTVGKQHFGYGKAHIEKALKAAKRTGKPVKYAKAKTKKTKTKKRRA